MTLAFDFAPRTEPQRLDLPGADVTYLEHVDLGHTPGELMDRLVAETPWRSEEVVVWGKTHLQPRLIAWYGDLGRSYSYSGTRFAPLPWTEVLLALKRDVEAVSGSSFNSVLVNYYRNNRDSIGFHSDDERELGDRPVIASLSLGETRTLIFKPKHDKALKPVRVKLASGSLLVMRGDTQANWKHGIDKEAAVCGPRVNLTFRTIEPVEGSAGGRKVPTTAQGS